jgi:hypothetical protein
MPDGLRLLGARQAVGELVGVDRHEAHGDHGAGIVEAHGVEHPRWYAVALVGLPGPDEILEGAAVLEASYQHTDDHGVSLLRRWGVTGAPGASDRYGQFCGP